MEGFPRFPDQEDPSSQVDDIRELLKKSDALNTIQLAAKYDSSPTAEKRKKDSADGLARLSGDFKTLFDRLNLGATANKNRPSGLVSQPKIKAKM